MIIAIRRLLAAAILLLTIASAGTAQTVESYRCTLAGGGSQSGIIPPDVTIDYEGDRARIAHSWIDGPNYEDVRVTGNDRVRTIYFVIRNMPDIAAQRADLEFRFNHNVQTGRLTLRLTPRGYSNYFHGRGSCQRV